MNGQTYRLHPGGAEDFPFAQRLYVETQKPLMQKLSEWDEEAILGRLKVAYESDEVHIIRVDDDVAGWLQVSETPEALTLCQLHLVAAYRGGGLGTQVMRDLIARARAGHKAMHLSVVRGNPALALYIRLGFEVVDEDNSKLHMRLD